MMVTGLLVLAHLDEWGTAGESGELDPSTTHGG